MHVPIALRSGLKAIFAVCKFLSHMFAQGWLAKFKQNIGVL